MNAEIKERVAAINSGIIPEGYKKTKVGIVPVEWEVDHIGKHLQEYREISNNIEKYPVYSSSRKGLIPQSDYYDQKEATQTNLGYKIVPVGYVTYRHMSDDDIFHFNLNTTGQSVLVSSEYPVFNAKSNANLYYIISCLNEMPRFRYFCRSQKLGGTRTRLYYKNLSMYQLSFPPLPEQQKIAEILSTQDKLIELQEKKIEQLKELKKAYLQKMFPQKGSKYPELRFKGFTDPWEQRELSQFVEFYTGLTYSPSDVQETGTLVLRSSNVKNGAVIDADNVYVNDEVVDSENVRRGDIIVVVRNGSRALIGKHAEIREEMPKTVIGAFMTGIRSNHSSFVNALLSTQQFENEVAMNMGATINQITGYMFAKMSFMIPEGEEQDKIGVFFKDLDHLITLHQRKSEQEKQKKKALMQLLLTGIVRMK